MNNNKKKNNNNKDTVNVYIVGFLLNNESEQLKTILSKENVFYNDLSTMDVINFVKKIVEKIDNELITIYFISNILDNNERIIFNKQNKQSLELEDIINILKKQCVNKNGLYVRFNTKKIFKNHHHHNNNNNNNNNVNDENNFNIVNEFKNIYIDI